MEMEGIRCVPFTGNCWPATWRQESQVMPALRLLSGEFIRCQIGPMERRSARARAERVAACPPGERIALLIRAAAFLRLALRASVLTRPPPPGDVRFFSRFVGQILRELEGRVPPSGRRASASGVRSGELRGDLANPRYVPTARGLGN